MSQRLNRRVSTGYVGAGRSGVDYTSSVTPHISTCAKESDRAWLTAEFDGRRLLPQVPSPTQAAMVGWLTLWCVRYTCVNWLTSCTCGLLRLGVKRFQRGDASHRADFSSSTSTATRFGETLTLVPSC